jgi:hypothetical protein
MVKSIETLNTSILAVKMEGGASQEAVDNLIVHMPRKTAAIVRQKIGRKSTELTVSLQADEIVL